MEKKTVLLVDDEADLLAVIGPQIEKWGYGLVTAVDGAQALEAVKNRAPHMVVLDYKLPDMDGVEVLRQIRKINTTIPVIMFTAHPTKPALDETNRLGLTAFVPKLGVYSDVGPLLKSAIHLAEKTLEKTR